jgi:hypothetical protein
MPKPSLVRLADHEKYNVEDAAKEHALQFHVFDATIGARFVFKYADTSLDSQV